MNPKSKVSSEYDKYNVEASSKNDWNGYATTEMTGLIPASVQNEAELEAYKALYPFSPEQYEND
ncbi:MAG: GTPase [Lachnospiraceae bacterium]|jgi:hypothetical protein